MNYRTQQKLESGLEQLLQGNAYNNLNNIQTTVLPNEQTVTAFDESVTAFSRLYIPVSSTIYNQCTYLQQVCQNDITLCQNLQDTTTDTLCTRMV